MTESSAESNSPAAAETPQDQHVLYQVVAQRRCAYDSMLWSTPAISLAGLAFLFTIALDPDTAEGPRCLVSFLALCFALASAHLMYKHRYGEKDDSRWLENYERTHFSAKPVHSRRGTDPTESDVRPNCIKRWSAYCVWQILLLLFSAAALVILVLACFCPRFFMPSMSGEPGTYGQVEYKNAYLMVNR